MWRTEKAFDPKFISSVRFSLNTSQINVDDVKYSQSVRSSIRSRDIFEAISENSEIKMRRSIQVFFRCYYYYYYYIIQNLTKRSLIVSLHIHRNFTRNSTFYDPN